LLALAAQHNIDLDALPRSTGAASLLDDLEALDDDQGDQGDHQGPDRIILAGKSDQGDQGGTLPTVDAALRKLSTGDWTGFRFDLDRIETEAHKPARVETVEKIVTVERVIDRVVNPITHRGHIPQVIDTKPASLVLDAKLANGQTLQIWDAPDAPALDLDYAWPAQTGLILAQMNRGRNVFLSGPRGCGKSTFAEQLAARQKRDPD
jgi:hypothetical protein